MLRNRRRLVIGILSLILLFMVFFSAKKAYAWMFDADPPLITFTTNCADVDNCTANPLTFSITFSETRLGDTGINIWRYSFDNPNGLSAPCEAPPQDSFSAISVPQNQGPITKRCTISPALPGDEYYFTGYAQDHAGNRYINPGLELTVTMIDNWIKMRNASFHSVRDKEMRIPPTVRKFTDSATFDNGARQFTTDNEGGGVITTTGELNLGTGFESYKGWRMTDPAYSRVISMRPLNFQQYIEARKDYKTITEAQYDADATPIDLFDPNRINVFEGDLDITTPAQETGVLNAKVILVIGDVTISLADGNFNNTVPEKPLVILSTESININYRMKDVRAVMISDYFSFSEGTGELIGGNTGNELYIKGNVIAFNGDNNTNEKRKRLEAQRPAIFIDVDAAMYRALLPYLSTITYEWKQVQ